MQNIKTFLLKATSIIGVALSMYVVLFFAWIMLMYGCTETHSVGECRDNTLTQVVMYPINLFNN